MARLLHALLTALLVATLVLPVGGAPGFAAAGSCRDSAPALDICKAPVPGSARPSTAKETVKPPCLSCILPAITAAPAFAPSPRRLAARAASRRLPDHPPDPLRRPPRG
ncbi:hypothetical protein [Pararhodobacter marinus]|uniref:hypothetical protein n=1 Tax=Pararhodobacter marinus TaxID=2184063 RepID=UPI0011B21096|nr:hypothetical protein [Pararhodobacter marinus]